MEWTGFVRRLFPRRDPLGQRVKLPAHVLCVHWRLPDSLTQLEWDVTIEDDPGTSTGEYLALYNGSIDDSTCYLGMQTDVSDPRRGQGIGKGLIFSTWWTV